MENNNTDYRKEIEELLDKITNPKLLRFIWIYLANVLK